MIDPITFIWFATAIAGIAVLISLLHINHAGPGEKKLLFWLITIPILIATFYTAGHTIHENIISETGGPVHWHADYQVWVCDERLDLMDPSFPKNKIGSPLFHEHNDDRIHTEGTVKYVADVDLGSFFTVIGGHLTDARLTYPTTEGIVDVKNGDECNNQAASLKVYVNGQRISDAANYLYYPHSYVPPGDCIIVEFSENQDSTTQRICESWVAKDWNYRNYKSLRGEFDGN